MKFRCDSCGKRFASVDEPFPGRVYKIRCSRCGQLLTVQAPVPWEAPAEDLKLDLSAPPRAAAARPAAVPEVPPPLPAMPARPAEETEEIPIDLALSDEYPLLRRRQARKARRLTVAVSAVAAAVLLLVVGLLLRAASLPPRAAPAVGPALATAPRPSPAVPAATARSPLEIPSEPMPTGPAPSRPPVAAAPAPAPRPAAALAEPPVRAAGRPAAAPPRVAPAPAAQPPHAKVAFEGQAGRDEAAAAPAAPAKVDPGLAAALLRKEDATVHTGLPDVTELRAILDGRRAALDACFDYAASTAGGAAWQGRAAQLVVRVSGTGRATAAVSDPALEPTEIASCLRRTIARTTFPPFVGEAVELRTPVAIPRP